MTVIWLWLGGIIRMINAEIVTIVLVYNRSDNEKKRS